MRWFKFLMTVVVLAIIIAFIKQNMGHFQSQANLGMNLGILEPLEWANKIYEVYLISGGLGFLIGLGIMFKPYFRQRRLAKEAWKKVQELEKHQVSLRKDRHDRKDRKHKKDEPDRKQQEPSAPDSEAKGKSDAEEKPQEASPAADSSAS